MGSKSFLSQSLHTIFSKAMSLGLVFSAGVVTARWLGPEGKGVVALYQALALMIFPVAELGIRQSTAYFVGKDRFREREIYSNMQGIYCCVALVSFGLVVFVYHSAGLLSKYGWFMSCVFGAVVPLQLFESYNNGVFISKKQIERINYLVLCDKFISLFFLIVLLMVFHFEVLGAGIAFLFSRCVCFLILLYWLKQEVQILPKFNWKTWQELLKQGVLFSVALFVIQLNYRFSFLFLEHFAGTASVGIYSVGVSLAEILKEIPLALGLVLFSRSANWKHQDIAGSLEKTIFLSRLVFLLMFVISVAWGLTAQFLIPFFYGDNFSGSIGVTWLLLPGIVFLGVFLVLNTFMAGQGKPYMSIFAFLPAVVINVFFSWMLIPRYGCWGAALSATLSYILGTLLFASIFVGKYKMKFLDLFMFKATDIQFLLKKFLKKDDYASS